MLPIYFAPLQGYTEDAYRRLHNEVFGGVEEYFSPFVRLEHGDVRPKDKRDVRPEFNKGVSFTPQIIVSGSEEMAQLVDFLLPQGYTRIDVNMGCPFPLQTRHGRGAGLLPHPNTVERMCQLMKQHAEVEFSVKMRLGLEDADEWRSILPLLNATPLRHITLHPRTARQQYKGEVQMDAFKAFLDESSHPVIFNGNVESTAQIASLEHDFPALKGVMIGRALLSRPSLAAEYASGQPLADGELIIKIKRLHSALLNHYSQIIPGEAQCHAKVRSFWDYMEPTIGRKAWKKIFKAGNMKNYLSAIDELR